MSSSSMERETISNIDVLIVGAGLAGLYAAIECYRQGHSPVVLEGKHGLEDVGQTFDQLFRPPDGTDDVVHR